MDFLILVWTKLAILSAIWMIGSVLYFILNDYPVVHSYTMIAFGPTAVIVLLPIVLYFIHFLFFVWE